MLSSRGDDAVLLGHAFARERGRVLGRGSDDVLRAHRWPGNVRELRFTIERACALNVEQVIPAPAVAEAIYLGASLLAVEMVAGLAGEAIQSVQGSVKDRLLAVYAANGWNASRAARALGLGRTTFFKQLKAHGISLREERSSLELRAFSPRPWRGGS